MYQTIHFERHLRIDSPIKSAQVGFFMRGDIELFERHFTVNGLIASMLDRDWVGDVYFESVGGEVCKVVLFEGKVLKKALVINWVRTSFHDVEKTAILYEIVFLNDSAPQVKVYRMEGEKLQFIYVMAMDRIAKEGNFDVFRCLQGTPIEISLRVFTTELQSAFSVSDRAGIDLIEVTSAECIKDPVKRLEAFLEFFYCCQGFIKLENCIEFQIQDLIEHLGSEWERAVQALGSRALYLRAILNFKFRVGQRGCSLKCQQFLEEVIEGKKLESIERLNDTTTLFVSNQLHLVFWNGFEQGMVEKVRQRYPDKEEVFVEIISQDGKWNEIEELENYFIAYEKEGQIEYYSPRVGEGLKYLHPRLFKRLELERFDHFYLAQDLENGDLSNLLFYAKAKKQPGPAAKIAEERLIGFSLVYDCLEKGIERLIEAIQSSKKTLYFNRMIFHVHFELKEEEIRDQFEPYLKQIRELNVEKVLVKFAGKVFVMKNLLGNELESFLMSDKPGKKLVSTASPIELRELFIRMKGGIWAYRIPQLIQSVVEEFRVDELGLSGGEKGKFIELDLDYTKNVIDEKTGEIDYNYGELIPVERPLGNNESGVIVGVRTDDLGIGIPVKRLLILGDLSHSSRGAIRAQECARLNAAIRMAAKERIPIDWFTASYGVQVHREKGVEGLDAAAATIREIIHNCHHKDVAINLIVDETNIGAQSYWDSMATILNETTGILIMTPKGCMALTGPGALVSALYHTAHSNEIPQFTKKLYPEGLQSLSGHELVHGPNSDSMIFAKDLKEAVRALIKHHYFSYVDPKEPLASSRPITTHDEESEVIPESEVHCEVENFLKGLKPDREVILEYLRDGDSPEPLRFWGDVKGVRGQNFKSGDLPQEPSTIVKEMLIGGFPTMVIFTATGPLTPADAQIIARGIYKASGRMQVLIIGSLSGFGCDPLSMENRQLLSGSYIAKAIVDHKGPMLVVNLGNLVGGTFVVFNKQLNPDLRILAIEGARVQVLGGKGAAKVVFHSQIVREADQDPRVLKLAKKIRANDKKIQRVSLKKMKKIQSSYENKRKQIIEEIEDREADLFDRYHNVQRAVQVGSIDGIILFRKLKGSIIQTYKEMREKYLRDITINK